MSGVPSRGFFFLANDPVLPWVLPFLHSFRTYDPGAALVLIPFDDRLDGILELQEQYSFSVLDSPILERLSALGEPFVERSPGLTLAGMFRKFAAFEGPFEEFMFWDVDTLALAPPTRWFDRLASSGAPFAYANLTSAISVFAGEPLRDRMRAVGQKDVNTGLWWSTRGLLDVGRLEELAARSEADVSGFAHGEQPFFNWVLATQGTRQVHFNDAIDDHVFLWAGTPIRAKWEGDSLVCRPPKRAPWPPPGARVGSIHWAGYSIDPRMPHWRTWRRFDELAQGHRRGIVRTTLDAGLRATSLPRAGRRALRARGVGTSSRQ